MGAESGAGAALMITFLSIAMFSASTAAWVVFLDFCYQPREVLARWGLLLTWAWIKSSKPVFLFGQIKRRPRRWWGHLTKPLGLCPYCAGFWQCSAFFLLMVHFFHWQLWFWLPAVGLNYVFTKLYMKL
jgi:hypothetical protein